MLYRKTLRQISVLVFGEGKKSTIREILHWARYKVESFQEREVGLPTLIIKQELNLVLNITNLKIIC